MQEYEALLILAEKLSNRDVLDGRGGRTGPVFLGHDGLQGDRHGGGPAGPVVGAGTARVDVAYVLDTCLWQAPHVERDLYTPLDVLEDGGPAHPGIAALGELNLRALPPPCAKALPSRIRVTDKAMPRAQPASRRAWYTDLPLHETVAGVEPRTERSVSASHNIS